ncbi:MAG TPA: CHAD domain-containing protein [Propionibacteriaceae bacterium]|nr:CHAD domain-containing protein [Propionibacteriaceae bacterium]
MITAEGSKPDSPAVGQVRKRLTDLTEESYQRSWQQTINHFDSPRYDSFTRTLDGFADLPPWTRASDTAAGHLFLPALRQEWTRMLSQGRGVQELRPGPERDRRLHALHRTAKRVKDVAEAQEAISGRKVKQLRKVAGALAATLGEHHDVVLTGQLLNRVTPQLDEADGVIRQMRRREAAEALELYDTFVKSFGEADRKPLRSCMS